MAINKQRVEELFAKHVAAAVEKAEALGIAATWNTEKHRAFTADCIAENCETIVDPVEIEQILLWCSNESAARQKLEARFEKTKHFPKAVKKTAAEGVDDLLGMLAKKYQG